MGSLFVGMDSNGRSIRTGFNPGRGLSMMMMALQGRGIVVLVSLRGWWALEEY